MKNIICSLILCCFGFSYAAHSQSNDKRWYLKNNLQKHEISINFFDWLNLNINNKYDLDIPHYVLPVSKTIKIGVLDSFDIQHPRMRKYFLQDKASIKSKTPMELSHGTGTTGVMTAIFDQLNLGNKKAEDYFKVLPLQLISGQDNFNLKSELKRLLKQALDDDVDILSTSVTWPMYLHDEEMSSLLDQLTEKGVLIVVAAGNHHSQVSDLYPCMYSESICVGGANFDGSFAQYFDWIYESGSNYGPEVDVIAPAVGIYTYRFLGSYDFSEKHAENMMKTDNGTSYAQPMVAAQLAILKSIYPNESVAELKARVLMSTKYTNSSIPFFFNDFSPAQFGAISFKDSILFRPTIENLPVYLKRSKAAFYVEKNDTQVKIPVHLVCLFRQGCNGIKTEIEVWQTPKNTIPYAVTKTQVDWGARNEISVDLPVQISTQKENRLQYVITSTTAEQTKKIQGQWKLQIKAENNLDSYIDIDSQISADRYSGVRRLNRSSDYTGIENNKFILYVAPNSQNPQISIVDLINRTVVSKTIPNVNQVKMGFIGDANSDGQADIQLITLNMDKKLYLYYLNMNLEFLDSRFPAPLELKLATGPNKELVFPNDSSNIKWSRQIIAGQLMLVPWFIDHYPTNTSRKFFGLAPKAYREAVINSPQMQKQIVRFVPISNSALDAATVTDANFYVSLYEKLNLNVNADLKILGPKNYDPNDTQILIYTGERGFEENKILNFDTEKQFAFSLKDSPFVSVLNPTRSSLKNAASEVQSIYSTFYVDQFGPNQLAFYYNSSDKTYEFGLVSQVPVRRVLGAFESSGRLNVIILNNLGIELWSATPQMSAATLRSFYPVSYANTFSFMENISRFIAKQYLPNGTMDVRIYNSISGGDSYMSVGQNPLTGALESNLAKSLTVPPRCIPWEVSNLRLSSEETLFEVFFCPDKDRQKLFIVNQ